MMEAITDISYELDVEALSRNLRLRPGSDHVKELAELVDKVQERARPKALYKESFIDARDGETLTIDGVTFTSRVLRKNLDKVERVFPYIATCGTEADDVPVSPDDFLAVFWLDTIKAALLSVSVRHLSGYLARKYRLEKTSVMSPGSGDVDVWPIEQQREFFSLFGDVKSAIGVRLTDSFLMIPNKSVSGIRYQSEADFQTCELCHREICSRRRAPFNKKLWESMQND